MTVSFNYVILGDIPGMLTSASEEFGLPFSLQSRPGS